MKESHNLSKVFITIQTVKYSRIKVKILKLSELLAPILQKWLTQKIEIHHYLQNLIQNDLNLDDILQLMKT